MPRAQPPPPDVEGVLKLLSDEELRQELERRRKIRVEKLRKDAEAENAQFFDRFLEHALLFTEHLADDGCSDDTPWNSDKCSRCQLMEFQNQGAIDVEKRVEVKVTVKERSWNA